MPRLEKAKPETGKSEPKIPKLVEHVPSGTVYVEKGVTKNMGDYNSAKITVGVTLPINPSKSDIIEARKSISIASDLLDEEIEKQVSALMT